MHKALTSLRAAIERATDDLDGIVAVFQALLRIAEIEAGSRRSSFAQFDLRLVLDGLHELYEAVCEEKEVQLRLDAPPSLMVFGDRELVQQAVANLLDNAIKFSPPAGSCDDHGGCRFGGNHDQRGGSGAWHSRG